MRFWLMSDLHLEFYRDRENAGFPAREAWPEHDVVLIAGDICEHLEKGVAFIAEQGLNAKPVYVVAGNHEFYRDARDKGLEDGRRAARAHRNIHILQDEMVVLWGADCAIQLVGTTLWTDYAIAGEASRVAEMDAARMGLNDHRLIRVAADNFRKWQPKDAFREHVESRRFIERCLSDEMRRLVGDPVRSLVMTHHAPSRRSITHYSDHLAGAYASDLEVLVDRADLWVHGHSHGIQDYRIGNGRVIANTRGYPGQCPRFDPALVVTITRAGVSASWEDDGPTAKETVA